MAAVVLILAVLKTSGPILGAVHYWKDAIPAIVPLQDVRSLCVDYCT